MYLVSSHKSLLSRWTSQQTSIFIVQRGTPKYIWIITIILSRPPHTLDQKPFSKCAISLIHCSFLEVHGHYSFNFLDTISYAFLDTISSTFLDTISSTFLDTISSTFLDTISSTFFRGTAICVYSLPLIRGSPPYRLNRVDSFTTRLPGCASTSSLQYLCLCTPGSTSGPGPGCYL